MSEVCHIRFGISLKFNFIPDHYETVIKIFKVLFYCKILKLKSIKIIIRKTLALWRPLAGSVARRRDQLCTFSVQLWESSSVQGFCVAALFCAKCGICVEKSYIKVINSLKCLCKTIFVLKKTSDVQYFFYK